MARSHSSRNRNTSVSAISRSGSILHWLGMLAMVVGLFAPLASVDASATIMTADQALMKAMQQPFDRDTSDFERVVLTGDFQQQVGCNNWDTNCDQSRLVSINGFWTGVFNIPPGTYNWELVAVDRFGTTYSIDDDQANIAEGQAGIYAEFNSATRDSDVSVVNAIAYANGAFGDIALNQDGDGFIASSLNIANPGWVDINVTVNGVPSQTGADFQQGTSRVTFDSTGFITNVEHRGFAEITVQRTDSDGNALAGSCFELEGSSSSRGCDTDGSQDGSGDGSTTLRFPGGFQPGNYTLRETRAADGAEQLSDQQIDVQQGQSSVEARSEGEATPETGDLVVLRQDENGQPVGGACFEITNSSGEVIADACDETGDVADDGRIGLLGVPSGDYTLTETRTPEGFETAVDIVVTVSPNEVTNQLVQSNSTGGQSNDGLIDDEDDDQVDQPIDEPEDTRVGRIIVYREDDSGNRMGGACYDAVDTDGNVVESLCDEDGFTADDGVTGLPDLPLGTYNLIESRTPEGVEPAQPMQVTIVEGDNEYVIRSAPLEDDEQQTRQTTDLLPVDDDSGATLVVTYTPVDGQPALCVELEASGGIIGMNIPFACDNSDNDNNPELGTIEMRSLDPGNFQVVAYEGPDYALEIAPIAVTLTSDQTSTVAFERQEPARTSFSVQATEDSLSPVGEACFILNDNEELCDASGRVTFNDVLPGDHVLRITSLPQGYTLTEGSGDTQNITVLADGSSAFSFLVVPQTTSFTIQSFDGDTQLFGACYLVSGEFDWRCDDGSGTVNVSGVAPGEYTVEMVQAPENYTLPDPASQTQLVSADGDMIFRFDLTRATTSFTAFTTVDGTNPVGESCFLLDDTTELCGDGGSVTFSGVLPGEHTVQVTKLPPNYNLADGGSNTQPVSVAGDGSTVAAFQIVAATGNLTVTTSDGSQNIAGACYFLNDQAEPSCDDGSGVTYENVPLGDHTVRIQGAPSGYNLVSEQTLPVSITSEGGSVTFQVELQRASLVINASDGTQNIAGACYVLDESSEPVCDDGSGVTFQNLTLGDHTVRIQDVPAEYSLAGEETITINVPAEGAAHTFNVQAVTVDIRITTVNQETNDPLVGACYSLDGGEIECDDAQTGEVIFVGEAPGEKTLSMETAPEGFEPSSDQMIAAGVNDVEVGLLAETGSMNVSVLNADGDAPLTGFCVRLDADEPTCDDTTAGTITFDGVPVGSHEVEITSAPLEFDLPAEGARIQNVEVVVDPATSVIFRVAAIAPATGNLDVTVQFAGDTPTPAEGACVLVYQGETQVANGCDDNNDGIVNFTDLQVGDYQVTLDTENYSGPRIEPVTPVSANVEAKDEPNTATLNLNLAPTTGSLEVKVTTNGALTGGTCITIAETEVCDDAAGVDGDPTAGVILVTDLEPNSALIVSMTTVPTGYQPPADQTVEISAGNTASIEFQLVAVPQAGTVTVSTQDDGGSPLLNACYQLRQGTVVVQSECDADPADGSVSFANLPAGEYRLVQTGTPTGPYQTAPDQLVQVAPGGNVDVTITMSLQPGGLIITTVDAQDRSVVLQNACYELLRNGTVVFGPFCDADDSRGVDGQVRFTNLPAGEYELRQTQTAPGFALAANRTLIIRAGVTSQITVDNPRVQPPAETGTLVVIPLDPNGAPVAGGCYQLFDGTAPVTNRICDNADDQPAQVTFQNVPVGEFTLREALAPSPDWQIAADRTVTITNNQTTRVEVPHEYKPGNVVIQAVNSVGLPLQGACFTLTDAGNTELCTNSSGQATITGLTPGARQLTQTKAPFGFRLDETPRDVTVRPGQTTTVRVMFENEPPPNTGTVQVQKFFCPAGDEGERTRFLGGAQGNQELKQTVGCQPGVASFTLVAEDGSTESNAEFSTNDEGRAQLTAVAGIYLLTETDPDLPGNSAARIRVGVGQMTTVIVINYVAPPAPAPVTINVEGYTCAPGFSGSSFVDFQSSCMADSQLTNQITVRAEAESRYKRVTGDTGVRGKTAFTEIPAGTYSIWAQRPQNIPVSYLFCGPDVNNPSHKALNGSVSIALQSGSTITCRVFQVPPLFDAEHGAIQVHKFNCPINERQRGFDYQNECSRATEPVAFQIQRVDPTTKGKAPIGDPIRVNTNADGIVQFPMLAPGTYKLSEVEGEWCFAQSNSVDAQGDVVVHKNKLSEVWIYNCVGTKSPPNTGSGDAANILGPDGELAPMQMLPNLIWPAVLLVGWIVWKERKQA